MTISTERFRISKSFCFLPIISLLFLTGCGIADDPIIYPIPQDNVNRTLVDYIEVDIPGNSTAFEHFEIFYRIYISDRDTSAEPTTEADLLAINPTLNTDHFSRVNPYIEDENNIMSSTITTVLSNLKYYKLALEEGTLITSVLSSSSLNKKLIFDFQVTLEKPYPTITVGNGPSYNLQRSNVGGSTSFDFFEPDKYFINSEELREGIYLPLTNGDINDTPSSDKNYTFVNMYIIAVGLTTDFRQLYSSPTWIGVLRLPEP